MHPAIAQHRTGISAICKRYRISRLEVFGSAARAHDFDPASSDADFLVEFAPEVQPSLETFFGAKADLEQLLGRGVDLVGVARATGFEDATTVTTEQELESLASRLFSLPGLLFSANTVGDGDTVSDL